MKNMSVPTETWKRRISMRTQATTRNLEANEILSDSSALSWTRLRTWPQATPWTNWLCLWESKRTLQPEVTRRASARLPSSEPRTLYLTIFPQVQVYLTKVKFCSSPLWNNSLKAQTRAKKLKETCKKTSRKELENRHLAKEWFKTLRLWIKTTRLRNRFKFSSLKDPLPQQQLQPQKKQVRTFPVWGHRRSRCNNASTTHDDKCNEKRTTIFECLICVSST